MSGLSPLDYGMSAEYLPASDKLTRGAQTRSTPCQRPHIINQTATSALAVLPLRIDPYQCVVSSKTR